MLWLFYCGVLRWCCYENFVLYDDFVVVFCVVWFLFEFVDGGCCGCFGCWWCWFCLGVVVGIGCVVCVFGYLDC